MTNIQKIFLATIGTASLGLAGCSVSYTDQGEQPVYISVAEAPPEPPAILVVPDSPGPDYVWIDGYYSWDGSQYDWDAGRWALPPSGFGIWVAPTYDRNQHRYMAGHWQAGARQASPAANRPNVSSANRNSPANQTERKPALTSPRDATVARPDDVRAPTSPPNGNTHTAAAVGKTPPAKNADNKKHVTDAKDAPKKDDSAKDDGDAQKKDPQDSK